MLRKHVRVGSAVLAVGLIAGVLTLSGCSGGGSASEGANAMAGLETPTEADPNQNLAVGGDLAIPAEWPTAVPVFASGTLATVGVNPDGGADASWTTTATSDAVAAEYEAALVKAGYTKVDGSEITGVEDMSGADYSGPGYSVNMLVSTTDGVTSIFITATPA